MCPTYYMGDWIFHAILSMAVGALGFLYFLNKTVLPPNKSIFEIVNNDFSSIEQTINQTPRGSLKNH